MENDEIMARVAAIIRRQFSTAEASVSRETTALDVDGWDSLSHTILMVKIEKEFAVRFSSEELFSLRNVGELVDLIRQKRG